MYSLIERETIKETLCNRLEVGESMEEICRTEINFPKPKTLCEWLNKDEQFSKDYTRAREIGFILKGYDMLLIADNVEPTREEVAKAALQINTRQWLLSRLLPKKFGSMATQTNIQIVTESVTGMQIIDSIEEDPTE